MLEKGIWELYVIYTPSRKVYGGMHRVDSRCNGYRLSNGEEVYLGSGVYIHRAIKKYGADAMTKVVVGHVSSKEEADQCEKWLISRLRNFYGDLCMNLTDGGGGTSGYHHSKDTIEYLRYLSSLFSHSEESKRKIGDANKGHPVSKEHREVLRQLRLGSSQTQQTIKKIKLKNDLYWSTHPRSHSIPVQQVETGLVFNSMASAGKSIGKSKAAIRNACIRKGLSGGYHWRFV